MTLKMSDSNDLTLREAGLARWFGVPGNGEIRPVRFEFLLLSTSRRVPVSQNGV